MHYLIAIMGILPLAMAVTFICKSFRSRGNRVLYAIMSGLALIGLFDLIFSSILTWRFDLSGGLATTSALAQSLYLEAIGVTGLIVFMIGFIPCFWLYRVLSVANGESKSSIGETAGQVD